MKGYSTGVVDTNEHGNAPHYAGPLPLELVRLPQMAVKAGIQQADNSYEKGKTEQEMQNFYLLNKQFRYTHTLETHN